MEVAFGDAALAKICGSEREMRRHYGTDRSKKLQLRLKTLDLDHPYRLLIRPAEVTLPGPGGGLDWSAVRSVVVVSITDTHE